MLSEGVSVDSTAAVEADELSGVYETALMLAIRLGHNRIARLLLERGADVHARDSFGSTAVCIGAWFGNVEMVAALVAAGGDLNAANEDGATPIWTGQRNGATPIWMGKRRGSDVRKSSTCV